MKKTLLVALLLLIHFSVLAQTEKGRWMAGIGIGSFGYQSNQAGHSFSSNLSPLAGRFIAPNFLVGVGLPLSFSSSKYVLSTNTNVSVGVSPFTRYYFGSSSLKPLVSLSIAYEYLRMKSESTPDHLSITTGNTLQVSPALGLAYFINRSISLDALLGYNWASSTLTGSDHTGVAYNESSTYTNKNATLTVGFNVFFGQ